MTIIQEQAIDLIKRLPDEKVNYVINILEGIEGLYGSEITEEVTVSKKAYQHLQRFRKSNNILLDDKAELAEALEEKYESLG